MRRIDWNTVACVMLDRESLMPLNLQRFADVEVNVDDNPPAPAPAPAPAGDTGDALRDALLMEMRGEMKELEDRLNAALSQLEDQQRQRWEEAEQRWNLEDRVAALEAAQVAEIVEELAGDEGDAETETIIEGEDDQPTDDSKAEGNESESETSGDSEEQSAEGRRHNLIW